jgi:hypothetical protein
MINLAQKIYLRHKIFWSKNNFLLLLGSISFFIFALFLQHFAYNYIDNRANVTPVGDLLLDNLPTVDLDFFIIQGALLSTLITIILFLIKPKYLPFSVKALALFIIIRSFFISLTHLGANLHQLTLDTDSIGFGMYDFLYNAKNDFFFSGHVGAVFLFALIFWKEPFWRNLFFLISFIFAVSMIFAHMHYSIDIFAAPFITYSIFIIAKKLFKKDFDLIS